MIFGLPPFLSTSVGLLIVLIGAYGVWRREREKVLRYEEALNEVLAAEFCPGDLDNPLDASMSPDGWIMLDACRDIARQALSATDKEPSE